MCCRLLLRWISFLCWRFRSMLKASGTMDQQKRRLCQRDLKVDNRITFLLFFFCGDWWQHELLAPPKVLVSIVCSYINLCSVCGCDGSIHVLSSCAIRAMWLCFLYSSFHIMVIDVLLLWMVVYCLQSVTLLCTRWRSTSVASVARRYRVHTECDIVTYQPSAGELHVLCQLSLFL